MKAESDAHNKILVLRDRDYRGNRKPLKAHKNPLNIPIKIQFNAKAVKLSIAFDFFGNRNLMNGCDATQIGVAHARVD